MNNIYKVIWSKAKNCYVVASEIARSHTKSATGSKKIGGVTRRSLLASLMALSLLCGGLGVASAANGTVHVAESVPGTAEVYTAEKVDKLLSDKADKTALDSKANETEVVKNTKDIATNKENIQRLDTDKLSKEVASVTYATNKALNDLENAVTNKVDESVVEEALDGKANTDLSNLTEAGKSAIKNTMSADMDSKANKDTVTALGERVGGVEGKVTALENTVGNDSRGLVKDVAELKNQGTTLNNALEEKANKSDLAAATKRISKNEGNITALQNKTVKLSADGTELKGMTTVETGTLKVTGGISNGTVNTTLEAIDASMTQTATNKDDITTLKTKTDGQQTAIDDLKKKTTKIDYDVASDTTNVNGMKVGDQVDMGGKELTNVGNINGINIGDAQVDMGGKKLTNVGTINGIDIGDAQVDMKAKNLTGVGTINGIDLGTVDTQVKTNADDIKTNKNAITALDTKVGKIDDRTGGITRNLEDTQTTIEDRVKVDKQGNVKDVKGLSAETITTTGDAKVGGALTAGDAELKNTKVNGTLNVTGETMLKGTLTAEKNATFEKNVTVQKDLTVDGKLNVDKISMKNDELKNGKKHDSATTITADEISNLAKVTEQGNTTESQFTHNEKGTFNYAKDEKSTNEWKRATSNVTADGVSNTMTDSDGNTHTYYQTATETKEQLVNGDKSKSNFEKKTAEGNTISITEKDADGNLKSSLTNTQTVNGEKTSVTNEDSSSTINQGADQIRYNVTSKDENKTSSSIEVKADGITNTSKDGTITNTAKNVTNEGTESVTNKVGANEVKVSSTDGVDITAEAGKKITESVGTASRVVENDKITDTAGDSTVTTENGKGTTFGNGSTGTTNIYGDSITTGTIKAKDTTTDKLTAGAAAGENGGRLTVDANDGVKGSYKSGDYTSKSYILANTLKSGVDNDKEPTDADFVGSRTDHYMVGNKAKLDETVKDSDGSNVTNKTSTGTVTTITDGTGTTTTKTEQGVKDITNTAKDGTIKNDAMDIVNDAQQTITNTAGTSITNQVKDSEVTTDASGTTFENKTAAVSDGGTTTTKINGNRITTGRVDANELGVSDKDGDNTANLTVKAGEDGGVKASAGNGTTTGSLDVTAKEIGSSVTDASGKGSTFKQRIDAIMMESKNVSITAEETLTNEAKDIVTNASNSITEKVGETNVTTKTTTSSKSEIQNADTITSVQQTEKMVQSFVGKKDFSVTNVTTNFANASANQVTENGQTSTVLNNKDGLLIQNTANGNSFTTEDGTPTGTAQSWTNIKGNEISTGKVEANYVKMGYADVMKDLGVHGNAKIAGKTTTGSLEVTGTSTLTGEVIMGSNATVGNNLTVKGITTTKTLKVTENAEIDGNATIKGDVTARSYKVGDKTYIDANGIHANNQKITNVADGSISEGSKDAVNGGQLYGVKTDLEHKVDKVGANAAAMANLHPMEFDPDSKWNIAAAMGNYGSETATAIGAFYRPNEDVMVNFSTAFGTGENMVGGGVSVRLGKGGNKLSREETNALKDQVDDLTARMDALLSVLNPNMSKDFPDVPENHWAYEAVSRLAGNDIVQGYPDGEFHGDRTMTRYEMAEIIYNALSRGAEAERELVEEFKPELQAMAASEKATAEKAEG